VGQRDSMSDNSQSLMKLMARFKMRSPIARGYLIESLSITLQENGEAELCAELDIGMRTQSDIEVYAQRHFVGYDKLVSLFENLSDLERALVSGAVDWFYEDEI